MGKSVSLFEELTIRDGVQRVEKWGQKSFPTRLCFKGRQVGPERLRGGFQ